MIELNNNNLVTHFAISNYRNIRKIFGIKEKDRRGHMYMIGKTGAGKSTLIENMIISDFNVEHGVALIDPHGDLAENILHFVPVNRIQDVIYFNPADLEYSIAFNPLEEVHLDYHHLVASNLISVLKKVWPEFWGPRLEHILRNSIMALLEFPGSTLLDMPRLLTDKEFRMKVLESITNQQVNEFWLFEFEKYSARFRSEAISPILNKIGQFLTSIPLRNIVGQKENTFDLRKVMDEGKILIVNLAKGKIGEGNSSLLGAMMIAKIQLAAMSRANIPEEKRKPFYLYVDEFHNFITLSFADILSESRKYGLSLTLAHQYIHQLDEKISAAVFGNVGTLISFRVGAEDAKYLSREFFPVFDQTDLVNLSNHHVYLKLMIDGVTSKPFSATSLPPPERRISHKEIIIKLSRRNYGRKRTEVEKEILFKSDIEVKHQSEQGRLFS